MIANISTPSPPSKIETFSMDYPTTPRKPCKEVAAVAADPVPCALVVFDKDGTLFDVASQVHGYATHMASRLRGAGLPQEAVTAALTHLGWDEVTATVRADAPLLCAPWSEIHASVAKALSQVVRNGALQQVVAWFEEIPLAEHATPLVPDIGNMFRRLRAAGIKIAICTTDTRENTYTMLRIAGRACGEDLTALIDSISCSDDEPVSKLPVLIGEDFAVDIPTEAVYRKPDPRLLLSIMNGLGVAPEKTIMVGDSMYDMRMGRGAGCRAVVGVDPEEGSAVSAQGTGELRRAADRTVRCAEEVLDMIVGPAGAVPTATNTVDAAHVQADEEEKTTVEMQPASQWPIINWAWRLFFDAEPRSLKALDHANVPAASKMQSVY